MGLIELIRAGIPQDEIVVATQPKTVSCGE